MSAIFDVPLALPDESFKFVNVPLADGLRSSEDCTTCCFVNYLDPNGTQLPRTVHAFNEGVGFMGHMASQVWAHNAFHGKAEYDVEYAIPWEHGVTHADVVVWTGEHAGFYEVKTHSEKKPQSPSAANRRQVRRQMRLMELADIEAPGPYRLVMIGKAGNEGGWVRGPWTVDPLTAEDRAEADERLRLLDRWMRVADLEQLAPELRMHCKCGSAFPKPRVEASAGLDDRLQRVAELNAVVAAFKERKQVEDEIKKIRAQIAAEIDAGFVYEGTNHNVTKRSDGVPVVSARRGAA